VPGTDAIALKTLGSGFIRDQTGQMLILAKKALFT
jgi:hypothetical protein